MKHAYFVLILCLAAPVHAQEKPPFQVLQTPSGVRFAVMGTKPATPGATHLVFASAMQETLRSDDFIKIGKLLAKHGYLSVSLDVPSHGEDKPAGGLGGWRTSMESKDNFVDRFAKRASDVLDHLIKEGYTDPKKVVASGTSRGGFIALHFAAREPRVHTVVAFAPVIDLLAVTEFKGLENNDLAKELNLLRHADKLADRRVWICIGNQDARVNTDDTIAFTRLAVKAAKAPSKVVPIELHVMPTAIHRIHATAHEEAAAFVLAGSPQ